LDQLTSEQLSEWEAFDRLDPIGKWRDEFNFAVLDSLIVNIVSRLYSKKGHTPREVSPTEFMPNWSGEKKIARKQSVEEMKQALMALAKSVSKRPDPRKKPVAKNTTDKKRRAIRRPARKPGEPKKEK
jgi:adenine-specific DNA glycosylase